MRTKAQSRYLTAYIAKAKVTLGLAHWVINLADDTPEDGHKAEVRAIEDRNIAEVWVSDDIWKDSPEKCRHTIAHELLHVKMWVLMEGVSTALGGLPKKQRRLALHQIRHAEERFIDELAVSIAHLLPEWRGPHD